MSFNIKTNEITYYYSGFVSFDSEIEFSIYLNQQFRRYVNCVYDWKCITGPQSCHNNVFSIQI